MADEKEEAMPLIESRPQHPTHVKGVKRGEEFVLEKGQEPGRGGGKQYRSSRDSTGINASDRAPIHPAMPSIPPA